ncbi:AcrR family transcriptional regulator [Microbacterium halimionae]|uniref:AcrR family transcriptional regulator n=1 Tax=Microbacterium halimionae TaxID=1526413 RepID=A0A7W3JMK7_9MICO|nr:TetR/AcrR family transcriptional regulator [Microbacterium halimionae]MBA8815568.1 AcrR family transcriptional regulator [Microbacterium halimionae]NII95614.1 AcrR family transcriptional regulator [Microbacterium halimionae]
MDAGTSGAIDGRAKRWEDHRPTLLRAATEYALDTGVSSLTLRPLAQAIGTSITSLIRQFGSKDELVQEICRDLQTRMVIALHDRWRATSGDPAEALRALWGMWLTPEYMRQFAFLFELYGLALRDPERYEWFANSVVEEWMEPFEQALLANGHSRAHARDLTTLVLGIVRGLHLDLAATNDLDRVNSAFEFALDSLAPAWATPGDDR